MDQLLNIENDHNFPQYEINGQQKENENENNLRRHFKIKNLNIKLKQIPRN